MRIRTLILLFLLTTLYVSAQNISDDLKVGIQIQKTQSLYWENGIMADYSSQEILGRHLHINAGYLSSRLGTALAFPNAIKQDMIRIGAEWRFNPKKKLQFGAGMQTGIFMADYGDPIFLDLPRTSPLMAVQFGLHYQFKAVEAGLSLGYNLINGDGVSVPGSLFPLYYHLGIIVPLSIFKPVQQ